MLLDNRVQLMHFFFSVFFLLILITAFFPHKITPSNFSCSFVSIVFKVHKTNTEWHFLFQYTTIVILFAWFWVFIPLLLSKWFRCFFCVCRSPVFHTTHQIYSFQSQLLLCLLLLLSFYSVTLFFHCVGSIY